MGTERHIANESNWKVNAVSPDFCIVGNSVTGFNSFALINSKLLASPNVKAQAVPVYRMGDLCKPVQADAGQQVVAGTSLGAGHVKFIQGQSNVKVNGIPVIRHDNYCQINCNAGGVGGALAQVKTEQKPPPKPPEPPPKRSSDELKKLQTLREQVAAGLIDPDKLDEYVRFKDLNGMVDGIQGTKGTWTDYLAQGTRGVLKFGTGLGEGLYEAGKLVVNLGQRATSPQGQLLTQIDGAIFAENVRLGNITAGGTGSAVLHAAGAIVVPPSAQEAYGKGDIVEAGTTTALNVGTMAAAAIKAVQGGNAARATASANAARAEGAAATGAAAEGANAGKGAAASTATSDAANAGKAEAGSGGKPPAGDGVHVKKKPVVPPGVIAARKKIAEDFYRKKGFSEDSIKEHVKGIDFEKPVEVVTLKNGTEVVQYQVPGSKQGNYYALPGTEPDALGIAGQAKDRATGAIVDKVGTPHILTSDVEVLRSTSAPIKDTWSIPGKEIQTTGGGTQFFTTDKGAITPAPKG